MEININIVRVLKNLKNIKHNAKIFTKHYKITNYKKYICYRKNLLLQSLQFAEYIPILLS